MSVTVRSHAKINLGLAIGPPRSDGFHGLVTVYQTLALHDRVTVAATASDETAIHLTSNDARVPADARNTAWKMVELALESLGRSANVSIHIDKQLPVQGGLGAGSANAAAALVALEAELGIPVTPAWHVERQRLAAAVGSDVPLFLVGGTVLGLDRGQSVFPLPDQPRLCCLVATPAVGVSTPQAFRDWDALCNETDGRSAESTQNADGAQKAQNAANPLTRQPVGDTLERLSRVYASACVQADFPREAVARADSSGVLPSRPDLAGPLVSALVRTGIGNDFERVVLARHPILSEIKRILAAVGTPEESLYASLSGSGSSLFGLYRGQEQAEAVRDRLRGMGVDALVTHTLSRSAYWSEMLLPSGN